MLLKKLCQFCLKSHVISNKQGCDALKYKKAYGSAPLAHYVWRRTFPFRFSIT